MKRNNHTPMYGFGLPGQREYFQTGKEGFRNVIRNWFALLIFSTVVFIVAFVNVLIIGPWLGYVAGFAFIILIALWLWRILEYTQAAVVVLAGGSIAIGLWLAFGFDFVVVPLWWNTRIDWPLRWKAFFVLFSAMFIAIAYLAIFKFGYEVVDEKWPPPVAVRNAEEGIMWPWHSFGFEEEREERPQLREVPRPVPSNGALNVTPESVPDVSRVETTQYKTIIAPSDREVLLSDLVTFARLAPDIGASFRTWKDRKWSNQQWQDVVDTWEVFGVCTKREPRKSVKILVDANEALGRLSEIL